MVSNLVTANSNSQFEYIICVRQPGGALSESLRQQGITVVEPPQYFGFRRLRQSVNFIQQTCEHNQVCLIHAHMADAAFLGWLVARKIQLPLLISHHGHDILLKCNIVCRLVYYILLNMAGRFAAMNIAVSSSVAERVRQLLFVKKQAVRVISNGVIIPAAEKLAKKSANRKNRQTSLTLVTVGRLVPLKGHKQLIAAMAELVKTFTQLQLYIVGGGEMENELKYLASEKKVAQHINFTGTVDDVSRYLAKADIYVSTSESEGMPVSVLEAMAWQLPVVASDIPGNKSVVKQDETGFLYKLNDIDSLVKTILFVENNRESSDQVARRSRQMVEHRYSAMAAELAHESLYQEVLTGSRDNG